MAIINTHASALSIGDGKSVSFVYSTVSGTYHADELSEINLKLLVLLGCNAGHFDYRRNMATVFSYYITGKVLASDGTVYSSVSNFITTICSFTSKADDDFIMI